MQEILLIQEALQVVVGVVEETVQFGHGVVEKRSRMSPATRRAGPELGLMPGSMYVLRRQRKLWTTLQLRSQ